MRSEHEVTASIEQYADMVKRICLIHLKNQYDTEDIFQTVFLKYMLYTGSFRDKEHEKAWFARVTLNACTDFLRSLRRHHTVPLESIAEEAAPPEDSQRELLEAVCALPRKYKNAIYLHYYEGYSAAEIADILHKKENTIYTWLARGRERLKKSLGGDRL